MSRAARLWAVAAALPIVAGLLWLGVWQIERRAWKLALIAQVERHLAAAPVPAPAPATPITAADAYTKLRIDGTYAPGPPTFVQAATELGAGYWVIQPFAAQGGFTVLVNRGFVPTEMRSAALPTPAGPIAISGLLRLTEPHGGFLRANQPQADRWYSRDVAAIAAKRGLSGVAPYFVDADAQTSPGWPRGGLTVIRFRNSHLSYALTWFALAAGLAGAVGWMALRGLED